MFILDFVLIKYFDSELCLYLNKKFLIYVVVVIDVFFLVYFGKWFGILNCWNCIRMDLMWNWNMLIKILLNILSLILNLGELLWCYK